MAQLSDRALFLEMIKTTPMSISDIINQFGVARNTARSWAERPEVEMISGSYPRQYRRKDSYIEEAPKPAKKIEPVDDKNVIYLPQPTEEQLAAFFDSVMGEAPDEVFNFTDMFRAAQSIKDLKKIRTALIASIVLTDYYEKLMTNYEKELEELDEKRKN